MSSFIKPLVYLTALFISCATIRSGSADVIATFVNPANGNTYHLLSESTWQAAQNEALSLGGNLVTINDSAEQAWVFGTFGSYGNVNRSLWIGLHDSVQEGIFTWVSGETVSYTHWLPGQPDNNPFGDEDYVHMINTNNGFGATPGFWNDLSSPNVHYPEFNPLHGVVEVSIVPESCNAILLIAASFAFLRFRTTRDSFSSTRLGPCSDYRF